MQTIKVKLNVMQWRYLHRYRPELFGLPQKKKRGAQSGENNPRWNGGRCRNGGYILVSRKAHKFADKRGYRPEHRIVWEHYNKACLLPCADIHHINGVKDDNRIDNLQVMMHRQHARLEIFKIKPWLNIKKQKKQEDKS